MRIEDHCAESVRTLGAAFEEVHRWLDEYATTPLGARHRRRRHHLDGIAQVRRRWGDRAAEAARQHIASDLKAEGWIEGQDRMPADEQDYVRMGLF
jgi:DNA-binding GntR family transcriptional regulator